MCEIDSPGPLRRRWHTISETPTKKYDLIQGINARGAFIMTRECLPHMRRRGWGRVVGVGGAARVLRAREFDPWRAALKKKGAERFRNS